MKIKNVLGLVLCVLLTASVGHAASSSLTITTTGSASGYIVSGTMSGTAGTWVDLNADTAGPPAVIGTDVYDIYGNEVTDPEYAVNPQTVWTKSFMVAGSGSGGPAATFSVDYSVEGLLAAANLGDYALNQWELTLTLQQDLYASAGGGTRVDTATAGNWPTGYGVGGPLAEADTYGDSGTLTVASASSGGYQPVTLTLTARAIAQAYEAEVIDDGGGDDDGGDDNGGGDTAPIPAPGAVLLSSLGAGLVGWLRRRKTL